MEQFIDQITDKQFQLELENILQKKKPFKNFKNSIDNSAFRQKWFDFKKTELERIIEKQLKKPAHHKELNYKTDLLRLILKQSFGI